jgi:hypothetical protein
LRKKPRRGILETEWRRGNVVLVNCMKWNVCKERLLSGAIGREVGDKLQEFVNNEV